MKHISAVVIAGIISIAMAAFAGYKFGKSTNHQEVKAAITGEYAIPDSAWKEKTVANYMISTTRGRVFPAFNLPFADVKLYDTDSVLIRIFPDSTYIIYGPGKWPKEPDWYEIIDLE